VILKVPACPAYGQAGGRQASEWHNQRWRGL